MSCLKQKLIWESYIIAKALFTTQRIELINKKKFSKTALNKNTKTFEMHIIFLKAIAVKILIYLDKKAQIASLLIEKVLIPNKYSDFANVFSEKKNFGAAKVNRLQ